MLGAPPVRAGTLALEGRESLPGEPVSVTALLTNTTDESVVYTAVLWVNSCIETTQSVVLKAGESVPVRFWVTRPIGSYALRLDRCTATLAVRTGAEPASGLVTLPSAGGFAPSGGLLAGARAADLALVVTDYVLVLASFRKVARRRRTSAAPESL